MANLNEDILCEIFDYLPTPFEWIQVSRVCKLWKTAASRQWKKIREINYLYNNLRRKLKPIDVNNAPIISMKDVAIILHYAAPFVKSLIGGSFVEKPETLVMFGPFLYRVTNLDPVKMLELLVLKANEITEIYFDQQQSGELEKLFSNNTIKKVTFEKSLDFYTEVDTDDIEDLTVGFENPYEISSFEGKFPKLKKLNLELRFKEDLTEPQQIVSKFLPHVVGVTSLRLCIKGYTFGYRSMSSKVFLDIAKLPQLEHLIIDNHGSPIEVANFFLTKLVEGCPKLRSVKLINMRMYGYQLRTLLSLPLLESLSEPRVSNFKSLELSEIPNLRVLDIKYNVEKCDLTIFCNALKKMPNLRVLKMFVDLYARSRHHKYTGNETFELISQVATVVASQNKDMVVEFFDRYHVRTSEKMKMLRRNVGLIDAERQPLIILVSLTRSEHATVVERVQSFVREKLDNYYMIVV